MEREGAVIRAYDPVAIPGAKKIKPGEYPEDSYEALHHADALLVLTDWPEFEKLDYSRVKELIASPNLADGKNLLDSRILKDLGFKYRGVGWA